MKKLFLSLVAFSMLALPSAFAAPEGLSHLNGDADILVHFNSKRLQQSQTFKDVMAMVMGKAKGGLDEVKAKTSVDPLKDIDTVTVQVKAPTSDKGSPNVLAYVQGRFNAQSVLSSMKKDDKTKVKEEKTPWGVMYVNPKDKDVGFAFVKGGMLFGTPGLIKSYKKGAFKGPLAKLASRFKDQSQDLWVAVKMSKQMRKEAAAKNPMMAQFVEVTGSLDFAPGLHLNVRATGENAAGPQQIAKMAQAQLAASAKSPQAAMFAGMMAKVSVKAEGNDLVVDVPFNQQDVNQIKMMVGMALMSFQSKAKAAPKMPPPAPASK